jgi:hypothetical protein
LSLSGLELGSYSPQSSRHTDDAIPAPEEEFLTKLFLSLLFNDATNYQDYTASEVSPGKLVMNCWSCEHDDEPSTSNKWQAIAWPAKQLLTSQELLPMELVSNVNQATSVLRFCNFVVPCALLLKPIIREPQLIEGVASETTFGSSNLKANYARAMH